MKKITFIAAFAIATLAANSAFAQSMDVKQPQPVNLSEQEPDDIERLKDQLNLTPEQKAKIKAIREKRVAEREDLKTKLKAIREAERAEIAEILTDEQKAIIKAKREEKRDQFKGNHPPKKDHNHPH